MQKLFLLASAAALIGQEPNNANGGVSTPIPTASIADVLLEPFQRDLSVEQYSFTILGALRQADMDQNGLDAADVKLVEQRRIAGERASAISQALQYDLDGNLRTDRFELAKALPGDFSGREDAVNRFLERFDANADGVITMAEAAGAITGSPDRTPEALLALDPNRDGRLTAVELRAITERTFRLVDRNGDGTVSESEFAPIVGRVQAARRSRYAPVCKLPPVPTDAQLVVFGTYEGDAISSAVVGGPDKETNLIDVSIEPGEAPLYVVLTSYESMVWRFTGATNRVVQVAVTSYAASTRGRIASLDPPNRVARMVIQTPRIEAPRPSAAGVVGLPAKRVAIAASGCPGYFSNTDGAAAAKASLLRSLSRDPDALFATYSAKRVSLPSGTITKAEQGDAPTPRGFDEAMWQDARRYWPAGLVPVDSRRVVAAGAAAPYQVLPSQMGLAQLIGAGAIERTDAGAFRVVRSIPRLPPGMGGAHSVTLILAKGVPLPPGDPVHSCIVSEETGSKRGAACRNLTPAPGKRVMGVGN